MRLLIVSQHFWPESFRINDFARTLHERGCAVTVLTGQPNYPEGSIHPGYRACSIRREQWEGVEILRVPLVPRGDAGSLRLAANYLSFVVSGSVAGAWELRGRDFDAILVYGTSPILQAIPAIVLKWLKKACLVTWVQDLWPESLSVTGHVRNRHVLTMVDAVVRWIYRRNDLLLGQSHAFLRAMAPKAGRTPLRYFPNPGERAPEPAEPRAEAGIEAGRGFHIIFAGNLGKAQSLETILLAAQETAHLGDLIIDIYGSGSQEAWLRAEVTRRGCHNIRLHGRAPQQQMPAIFARADALLVTLGQDPILTQTVPSKVQAYLQAGKPILAAIDGEGADVVRQAGAGLVSPAGDAAALAANMVQMYRTPASERSAFGTAGRRHFEENYDLRTLADRLVGMLEGMQVASPHAAGKGEWSS